MMKRWLILIMMFSLVVLPAAHAAAPITLKWTTCCAQLDRHELFQSWARRYEARNPGVKIEWEYPAGSYGTVMTTRIAGGTAPDVMWIGGDYWRLFDSYISMDEWKTKANGVFRDTMPSVFPLFSWQGKLSAAPYGANTVPMFIGQRVFAEAGLGMPAPSWTWNDFIQIAKRLARDLNGDGTIDQYAFDLRPGAHEYTAFSWGGAPFTVDAKRAAFNNPITVEATQVIADLLSNRYGNLSAPAVSGANTVQMLTQIKRGVGMIAGGVWAVPTLRELEGDDWEAVTFPWLEYQGKRYRNHFVSGEAWAISNQTKYPEEARRFVEFLLDREQMTEFAKLGGIIPAQSSVARAFFTPTSSRPRNMAAFLDALETAYPLMNNHPVGASIYTSTAAIRAELFSGRIPASTALQQMEKIANQMLDEYWAKR